MAADETRGTVPLSDLDDFKVADGAPDVRGWEVATTDGREFGEVKDLLVDTVEMRTRYLAVELDRNIAADRSDRRILIPVGAARLDDDNDRVIVDASVVSALPSLPAYAGGRATADHDRTIGTGLGASGVAAAGLYDEDRFFGNRHRLADSDSRRIVRSEEELRMGRRQAQAGDVAVHRHVDTDTGRVEADVRRERIDVDDEASTRRASRKRDEDVRP